MFYAVSALVLLSSNPPARSVEVRVLSYNIRYGENNWGDSNLREVLSVIRRTRPHVVALQAVDSLWIEEEGRLRFQLRQLATQLGMYYVYGAADSIRGGSQGVGLLSVWPFEKTQQLLMPRADSSDPRTLLCGLIFLPRKLSFRVCTARLEYASVTDRAFQAAFINHALGSSVQPVVVAMDMGARPNEQPYFSFTENWLDAARGSQLPTWVEGLPGDRLDYIFVLKNTKVNVKEYNVIRDFPDASDHYPILTTLEFY
jgi:endonuclease/exonuclease/phosphatase family metal-dependent hydrolase